MSSPCMCTDPDVGGRTPAITLKRVVFPAPLGPIRPVIEFSSIIQAGTINSFKAAELFVYIINDDHTNSPATLNMGYNMLKQPAENHGLLN